MNIGTTSIIKVLLCGLFEYTVWPVGFFQEGLNIRKYINVIHQINRSKRKMIISISAKS